MKRTLMLEIDCGETTCASEPEQFCRNAGVKGMKNMPWCLLFGGSISLDENGCYARCKQCLDAEERGRDISKE